MSGPTSRRGRDAAFAATWSAALTAYNNLAAPVLLHLTANCGAALAARSAHGISPTPK
jgi:hypothetical protein